MFAPFSVRVPAPALVMAPAVEVLPLAMMPVTVVFPVPEMVRVLLVAELEMLMVLRVVSPELLIVKIGLPARVFVRSPLNVKSDVPAMVVLAAREIALASVLATPLPCSAPPLSISVPVPKAALSPATVVPAFNVVLPP